MKKMSPYVFYSTEFKSLDDNTVEGYISTGDLDLVQDIVTPNCMVDMLKQLDQRSIKMDVEHEAFRGKNIIEKTLNKTKIPVGKIVEASLDKKGIKVKTELNPHHSRYEEVKNSIKDGFLDAFSIAFIPLEKASKIVDGKNVRMLEKLNLLNVAFTGNPVNPEASFTNIAMKSLDDVNGNGGIHMKPDVKDEEQSPEAQEEVPQEEAPKEEAPKQEAKEEPKEEAPKEESSDEEAEAEDVEAKSVTEDLKSVVNELRKDIEGLKSAKAEEAEVEAKSMDERLKAIEEKQNALDKFLSEPRMKARLEQMDEAMEAKAMEQEATKKAKAGPLDRIA